MRLIDADELRPTLIEDREGFCTLAVLAGDIESAPTVDAAPVVHGQWIERIVRGSPALICSQCRTDSGVNYDFDYCPNCGAKMDLQTEQKMEAENEP